MTIMREAMDKRVLGLPQARPASPHLSATACPPLEHTCTRWPWRKSSAYDRCHASCAQESV